MTTAKRGVSVPAGLRLRGYAGEADVPAIVRVMNAEFEHDGMPARVTLDAKLAQYRHTSDAFDPGRDLTLAEVDSEAVGYAVRGWIDVHDSDLREYRVDGAVVPEWRGRGVGRAVLAESMRRAADLARGHDTTRARAFGSLSHEGQVADEALLRSAGFAPARYFFIMGRPTLDDVPEVALPDGLEVRATTAADARALWEANVEAFHDHWGGFDDSEEAFKRWRDGPEYDPALQVVAFDGEAIAGAVLGVIHDEENRALGQRRGWVDDVFTRRPWRRRGLARALICRALVLLRDRGMTSAVLDVDTANPTGALGLYESVGFGVERRTTAWRKPMPQSPGR